MPVEPVPIDLLRRRQTHFLLWRPGAGDPALYIGQPCREARQPFGAFHEVPLRPSAQFGSELWDLPANECGLDDGQVYHYWFKVRDTNPYGPYDRRDGATRVLYCTDPAALTVDRRVLPPAPQAPEGVASGRPAAVVLYRDGRLLPCDPGG
ncbi:MAG: alpha-amylase family glycosyl hydrolase, partial [Chloroflexota bacterium]